MRRRTCIRPWHIGYHGLPAAAGWGALPNNPLIHRHGIGSGSARVQAGEPVGWLLTGRCLWWCAARRPCGHHDHEVGLQHHRQPARQGRGSCRHHLPPVTYLHASLSTYVSRYDYEVGLPPDRHSQLAKVAGTSYHLPMSSVWPLLSGLFVVPSDAEGQGRPWPAHDPRPRG